MKKIINSSTAEKHYKKFYKKLAFLPKKGYTIISKTDETLEEWEQIPLLSFVKEAKYWLV